MTSMNLEEAAQFLHMSAESLRRKAKTGEVPAAKPAKEWVFIKEDLITYVRSQYHESWIIKDDINKTTNNSSHTLQKQKKINRPNLSRQVRKDYASLLGLGPKENAGLR